MSWKKHLPLTTQCKKCPWKQSTNPNEIPNGYSKEKHENLSNTIADENNALEHFLKVQESNEFQIMACHCSTNDNQMPCVGWLDNQLTHGNNIALRIAVMNCDNIQDLKTVGLQHKHFKDTLPK